MFGLPISFVAVVVVILAFAIGMWRGKRSLDALMSPQERRVIEVAKQAERLRKTDPAAASRLLEQQEARLKAEEGALRARVPSDPRAAREFHTLATEDLIGADDLIKHFRKKASHDPEARTALLGLEETRRQLVADIEWSRRFLGPGEGAA
jgi:hypothetical protein